MSGRWGRRPRTEDLTNQAYSVERGSPLSRALPFLFGVAVLVGAGYAGLRVFQLEFAPANRIAELVAENARLGEELGRAKMQAEMDAATRAELERQLDELNAKVKALNEELSFFKRAQSSKQ